LTTKLPLSSRSYPFKYDYEFLFLFILDECRDTRVTNLIDFACSKYNIIKLTSINGTLLSYRRLPFLLHKCIAFTHAVFILP
jgi:hypothetical protein